MRGLVVALAIGGCGFSSKLDPGANELEPDVDAAQADIDAPTTTTNPDGAVKPPDFHLRIATIIDGESYVHIKGKMLWFENRIFAAPGRWDANGAAPWDVEPINLNTTAWLPTWPDVPNSENRDCLCVSSMTMLPIGVPQVPSTTTFTEINVRRPQGIIQYPSAANGWELIALVSDYTIGGAHAGFILELDVKPN